MSRHSTIRISDPSVISRTGHRKRPHGSGLRVRHGLMLALVLGLIVWGELLPGAKWNIEHTMTLSGLPVQSMDLVVGQGMTHALAYGKFEGAEENRLAYLVSRDHGETFSEPVFIDQGSEEIISSQSNPIRLYAEGKQRVAVYQIRGEFPGNGPLRIAVSSDSGRHWISGIMPVREDPLSNENHPVIAGDDFGRIHLLWLDDRDEAGSTVGLRTAHSVDGGLTWQGEGTIDGATCTCCTPTLTKLPGSRLGLLYRDHAPKDMRLALFDPVENEWVQKPVVGGFGWFFEGCPHMGGSLQGVAADGITTLHSAVWTGQGDRIGIHYLQSTDFGQTWQRQKLLDTEGGDPELAAWGAQKLVIAYRRGLGVESRIMVTESEDGGQHWLPPTQLSAPGHRVDHPRLIAGSEGFQVLWTETDTQQQKRLATHFYAWNSSP